MNVQFSWNYSTGIAEQTSPGHWRVSGHIAGEPFADCYYTGANAERRAAYAAYRVVNSGEVPAPIDAQSGSTQLGLQAVLVIGSGR
jgi:hypothetical protein